MLVLLIGLSSLTYVRISYRSAQDGNDMIAARFYAQSALELAHAEIHRDPEWRSNRGSGSWFTDVPLGDGTISLDVSILADGDSDPANNPVRIVGIGVCGRSTHKIEVRIEALSEKGGMVTTVDSGKRTEG